jgi:phage terminase large subunit
MTKELNLSSPNIWNHKYLEAVLRPKIYNILYGGAGSGKSQTLIQMFLAEILNHHKNQNQTYIVMRKVAATIRNSVYGDFKNKIAEWGVEHLCKIYQGVYEIHSGTNRIIFMGVDNPEKLKSLTQATYIWIEEATELKVEDYIQITLRLRGRSEHTKRFFLTFNPVSDSHWIKKMFFDEPSPKEKDNILTLHSTYKDSLKFLDPEYPIRMEALKDIDHTYWDVYANGNWGVWDRESLYMQKFDPEKHIVKAKIAAHPDFPLYLSWDFNVVNTCVVMQYVLNGAGADHYATINVLKTYRIGDLETLCKTIREEYPHNNYIITGDPAGRSRSSLSQGNVSAYQLLLTYMNLPPSALQVMSSSPSHLNTRIIDTLVFSKCHVQIAGQGNEALIGDFKEAKIDARMSLDSWKAKNLDKSHALDAWRYFSYQNFNDIASDYNLDKYNAFMLP